jgi:Arc/MetJ-type ribon-helix-helix transcriptional regulator
MQKEKITITLPKTLLEAIRQQVAPRGQSQFIAEAITFYLDVQQRQALEDRLIAGYQANAARDKAIAAEWDDVETETWTQITDEKATA